MNTVTELPRNPKRWYVNEYVCDRAYGGPEEGGWWYNTGRFVKLHGSHDDFAAANNHMRDLLGYIKERQKGLHEPGSVLCEGWPTLLVQDHIGHHYPIERPHYE